MANNYEFFILHGVIFDDGLLILTGSISTLNNFFFKLLFYKSIL